MKFKKYINYFLINLIIYCSIIISPVEANQTFPDVSYSHPYFNAISFLKHQDIVNGAEDGLFYPDLNISRAEILKISLKSANINTDHIDNISFPDVPNNSWYAKYVQTAKKLGIVDGFPDGLYRPHQTVTRAEALKILLNTHKIDLDNPKISQFLDVSLNDWFNPYVNFAQTKNLLRETNVKFNPNLQMQRKTTAEIIYRLLVIKKNNFSPFVNSVDSALIPLSETILTNTFPNITLENTISSNFYQDEIYSFKGRYHENSNDEILIFVVDQNGTAKFHKRATLNNGKFEIPLHFSETGYYKLGIGKTYNINITQDIVVLPNTQISTPQNASPLPEKLNIYTENNQTFFSFDNNADISKITVQQGSTSKILYFSNSQKLWNVDFKQFQNFKEGQLKVSLQTANSTNGSLYNLTTKFSDPISKNIEVTTHHFSEIDHEHVILNNNLVFNYEKDDIVNFNFKNKAPIYSEILIITPNGKVETNYLVPLKNIISNNQNFEYQYQLKQKGVYIFELNLTNGFSIINTPVYVGNIIPLIPDYQDFILDMKLVPNSPLNEAELDYYRTFLLNLINEERSAMNLPQLKADIEMNNFAQQYSDLMNNLNFFAHITPDGKTLHARRQEAEINRDIGENIAFSPTIQFAHDGLMRSAIHRKNIYNPNWTTVGIGITADEKGYYYVVEEFAARDIQNMPLTDSEVEVLKQEIFASINNLRRSMDIRPLIRDQKNEIIIFNWFKNQSQSLSEMLQDNGISYANILSSDSEYSAYLAEYIGQNQHFTDSKWKYISFGIKQDGNILNLIFVLQK